jgi:hypothetical protein
MMMVGCHPMLRGTSATQLMPPSSSPTGRLSTVNVLSSSSPRASSIVKYANNPSPPKSA